MKILDVPNLKLVIIHLDVVSVNVQRCSLRLRRIIVNYNRSHVL